MYDFLLFKEFYDLVGSSISYQNAYKERKN